MPEGVWDGESGHVVHRLPLEEGLPEVCRLRPEPLPPAARVAKSCSFPPTLEAQGKHSRNLGGIHRKSPRSTAVSENPD